MDALAGYGSDEGDNTEISSGNIKKVEINVGITSVDVQDHRNGEEKMKSKKLSIAIDDRLPKTSSLKYQKRELDCTVNAEITTREHENGQLINNQANTKDEEKIKEKEKTRHKSRSRSRSGHRSSRSKSRSPDRNYKSKGKRSRSHDRSRSRSRSHSRSPSHRSQKHSRHSGDKRSVRGTDSKRSRESRSDSHRRRHRSRSRSTSRRRSSRSRSKDRNRRRSRSRSHERKRSRSRSRTRHHKRSRSGDRSSRYRSRSRDRSSKRHDSKSTKSDSNETTSGSSNALKKNAEPVETSSKLPLKLNPSGSQMTPQLAVQQAMAAVNAKAQQLTGISLPKYYNPAAVNPMKYAEQMQKRKLLWNCNKEKPVQPEVVQTASNNNWEKTTFAQDLDGKMTAKFRKLMGIKGGGNVEENVVKDEKNVSEDQIKKQEEMFRKLDQQYEAARMSTHTHRGVGLGFTSQAHHLFPK